jgi:hypothetical protein
VPDLEQDVYREGGDHGEGKTATDNTKSIAPAA